MLSSWRSRGRRVADHEVCPDCLAPDCRAPWSVYISEERLACHEREIARLRTQVSELEAETMTLTSERDTARMGQDEWRRAALLRMADDEAPNIEQRAERVRAGESEGKPADEVFERLLRERDGKP